MRNEVITTPQNLDSRGSTCSRLEHASRAHASAATLDQRKPGAHHPRMMAPSRLPCHRVIRGEHLITAGHWRRPSLWARSRRLPAASKSPVT